jgi:hypothetical protein
MGHPNPSSVLFPLMVFARLRSLSTGFTGKTKAYRWKSGGWSLTSSQTTHPAEKDSMRLSRLHVKGLPGYGF